MGHEKEVVDYKTGEVELMNDNFVQLYIDKLDLIVEMTRENPTAVLLFTWLLKRMDKRNALVVSQAALAEALELHRTTIHRCTVYLQEKKVLEVLKSGNTHIYAINAQIAWKSDAKGKKYAFFDAAVYLADSEQDKPLFSTELVGYTVKKDRRGRPRKKADPQG